MKIFVKTKPLSHKAAVLKIDETHFVVSIREPPQRGSANRAVVKALAEYFAVAASDINIVSGFASRQKVVEIKNYTIGW